MLTGGRPPHSMPTNEAHAPSSTNARKNTPRHSASTSAGFGMGARLNAPPPRRSPIPTPPHACENIIVQAKELVEHIQRAIEAAGRLYALTAMLGPLDAAKAGQGGSAERR